MTVHRIVDAQVSDMNSSKVQQEMGIGRVTSTKTIRNKQSKDLEDYVKRCIAKDSIVTGDFKESIGSENVTKFMNETGLHDVFAETNGVEIENREATH